MPDLSGMGRTTERLIDVFVLALMLFFCWLISDISPEMSGAVILAAIKFWFDKNATAPPPPSEEEAAALAAAKILEVARLAAEKQYAEKQTGP